MPVDSIRPSQKARDHLVKIKRLTGIRNWNTACRWGFCLSLAEESKPPYADHPSDSNLELDWKTFGGEYADIYWALLKARCAQDKLPLDEESLAQHFRLHLHRGISYLAGDPRVRSISGLVQLSIPD